MVDLVKIELNYTTHVEGFDVGNIQLCDEKIYDRVSDVVENGGCFASKILTHNRMH